MEAVSVGAVKVPVDEALEYGTGWEVVGITDECDTCEHCGRRGLKRVVAMVPLDADGNRDGDAAYFGTGCAVGYAKRGGRKWTAVRIVDAANAAERERIAKREWAGGVLAKYEHVKDFDPIQKAAVYFSYNPSQERRGLDGAAEVDDLLRIAEGWMEGVSAEDRARYIALGCKVLGLPERPAL